MSNERLQNLSQMNPSEVDAANPAPLAFNTKMLRALGSTTSSTWGSRIRLGALCTVLILQQLAWYNTTATGTAARKREALGVGMLGVNSNLCFAALAVNTRRLAALRHALDAAAESTRSQGQVVKLERRLRVATITYISAYFVAAVGMTSLPWLGEYEEETGFPALPLPLFYPLDLSKIPGYAFTLFMHINIQFVYSIMIPIVSCTLVALMAHAALRLSCVAAALHSLRKEEGGSNSDGWEDSHERLRKCVQHHNEALKIVKEIEYLLRVPMGAQLLSNSAMFCAMGHQITRGTASLHVQVREGALLIPLVLQLFAFCWAGERVRQQGEAVAAAAWESKWETAPPGIRRDLQLVLLRAQKIERITALRIADVSLNTFGEVMRLSYSYYNLMNEAGE